MGNHQLPPQIHHQNVLNMLVYGISGKFSGMVEASWPSGSSSRRHASYFNTGFVTFVGEKETGNMLRSYLVDIHGGYYG